ncbi:MAG: hypothetical protein HOV80_30385 [Polyangiaceae bacterium]|nr:hypothetical protein [Polyangiaceae bacterium]
MHIGQRLVFSSLVAAALACSGTSEHPEALPTSSAVTGAKTKERPGFDRYAHHWTVTTDGDVRAILFPPSGEIVTVGGAYARVRAREDGKEKRAAQLGCGLTAGGVTFDPKRGVLLVCTGDIRSLEWPSLTPKTLTQLDDVALAAAFTDSEIAIQITTRGTLASKGVFADLVLFDRKTLKRTGNLPSTEGPAALSLEGLPAGLMVAVFQTGVALREPGSNGWRRFVKGGLPSVAVPSPNGKEVFLSPRPNESVTVDVASATITRTWRGLSPLSVAWLDLDTIATAGGGKGIRLLDSAKTEVVSGDDASFDRIAASPKGDVLCAHSTENRKLVCYFDKVPPGYDPKKAKQENEKDKEPDPNAVPLLE